MRTYKTVNVKHIKDKKLICRYGKFTIMCAIAICLVAFPLYWFSERRILPQQDVREWIKTAAQAYSFKPRSKVENLSKTLSCGKNTEAAQQKRFWENWNQQNTGAKREMGKAFKDSVKYIISSSPFSVNEKQICSDIKLVATAAAASDVQHREVVPPAW